MSSKFASPFMAKSPLKNDEPRRGKKTRSGKYTESTEYIRGGRAGDTGGRSVEIESVNVPKEDLGDAAGTGTADKDVTAHYKTVRTKSGKVKSRKISAKAAARIKKRKEKTHSTEVK